MAEYARMRGMRALRNFKTDRCYHLITRSANRAFYLTDEERTRFVERLWRVAKFSGSSRRTEATGGAAHGTGHLATVLGQSTPLRGIERPTTAFGHLGL